MVSKAFFEALDALVEERDFSYEIGRASCRERV